MRALAEMPDSEVLSECYGPDYYSQNAAAQPDLRFRLKQRLERSRSGLVHTILGKVSIGWLPVAPHTGARLLDIGCGDGAALIRAQSLGWLPEGCEFDSDACASARSRGFVCYAGHWWSDLPHEVYELVLMNQVLEHMSNPVEVLQSVRSSMVESGTLLLGLPNWDSSAAREFGADWWANLAPQHVWHPGIAHVKRVLGLSGFRLDRIRARNLLFDYLSPSEARLQWGLAGRAGWSKRRVAKAYMTAATAAVRSRATRGGPDTGQGSMYTVECTAVGSSPRAVVHPGREEMGGGIG